MYEAKVMRQLLLMVSAQSSGTMGFWPNRKMKRSTLLGALNCLLPRFLNPQCLVAACMVQSIDAELNDGGIPW